MREGRIFFGGGVYCGLDWSGLYVRVVRLVVLCCYRRTPMGSTSDDWVQDGFPEITFGRYIFDPRAVGFGGK